MRIVVANKFWYRRGGAESVVLAEAAALSEAGHEVAHFATAHPDNEPSPWSSYFPPYLELGGGAALTPSEKAVAAARLFHNGGGRAESSGRCSTSSGRTSSTPTGTTRQLSPSILLEARRRRVPVVQSLHDCHKVCPADLLLRAGGEACLPPRCRGLWYGPAVTNRCLKASAAVSALAAAELCFQRARHVYDRCVTRFISPSAFLAGVMADGGWTTPVDVVRNAVELRAEPPRPGRAFVYAGRLAAGKGLEVLCEAAGRAGVALSVAGDGPLRAPLAAGFPGVTFLGRLTQEDVRSLLRTARAAVLPSTCVENAPMALVEAMAAGAPVVATMTGGVPELVEDGREGLLVPPGDVEALARALSRLDDDAAYAAALGEAGRRRASREHGMPLHLEGVLAAYEKAIEAT